MSYTNTETETYTIVDIETVARRFTADLVMIAQSSGAITEAKARDYAYDVEQLAKKGYLKAVDVTLLSYGVEVKATKFTVNTAAGGLTMSRPGGVLWPRVGDPYLRIILYYTSAYTDAARESMKGKLRMGWAPTYEDTSHATLKGIGGRDYASNGYGFERLDYAA
jgi:hypothetical protein